MQLQYRCRTMHSPAACLVCPCEIKDAASMIAQFYDRVLPSFMTECWISGLVADTHSMRGSTRPMCKPRTTCVWFIVLVSEPRPRTVLPMMLRLFCSLHSSMTLSSDEYDLSTLALNDPALASQLRGAPAMPMNSLDSRSLPIAVHGDTSCF